MVLSRSGEGAGDAKFLLKCLALHPICLKTFVVLKVCSSIPYIGYILFEGAPLLLHTQLHTPSEPYTTAAVKDCPLQSSLRAVYRYPSPWYGVQNTPVGQRV